MGHDTPRGTITKPLRDVPVRVVDGLGERFENAEPQGRRTVMLLAGVWRQAGGRADCPAGQRHVVGRGWCARRVRTAGEVSIDERGAAIHAVQEGGANAGGDGKQTGHAVDDA